jgi:hypothetical protein
VGLTWNLEGINLDEILASAQALSNRGADYQRYELTNWLTAATATAPQSPLLLKQFLGMPLLLTVNA